MKTNTIPEYFAKEIDSAPIRAEYYAIQFYLEYVNAYLTLARMASDHGISEDVARSIYAEGKRLHLELFEA